MPKVRLFIGMTMDGFIADKSGGLGWMKPFESVDYGFEEFSKEIGVLLCGKNTYQLMLDKGWGWSFPQPGIIVSDEQMKQADGADLTFMGGDIADIVDAAKQRTTDKDVWLVGGAKVVQDCLRANLVDELTLCIIPVLLGDGIRLFGPLDAQANLDLQNVIQYDKGLLRVTYKVKSHASA
jgi:dihydrofolate reductase